MKSPTRSGFYVQATMLVAAMVFCLLPVHLQAQEETKTKTGLKEYEQELKKLIRKGRKSTVSVTAKYVSKKHRTANRRHVRFFRTSFSGVIIRSNGYIVTMGDPLENAREIVVDTQEELYRGRVIGIDPITNLAVVKINDKDLPAATFASPESITSGSLVVTIGNSFGFEGSSGHGIVSGRERTVIQNKNLYTDLIQMTAPVNPGDQGGLVLNSDGNMVGVISGTYQRQKMYSGSLASLFRNMIRSQQMDEQTGEEDDEDKDSEVPDAWNEALKKWMKRMEKREARRGSGSSFGGGNNITPEGIHFAIPVDTVQWVTGQLIKNGKVTRGWLGVEVENLFHSQRDKLGLKPGVGFRLKKVVPGSPAGKAGLKQDDVLYSLEQQEIKNIGRLRKTVFRTSPGNKISVKIIRDGKRKSMKIAIGHRPDGSGGKKEDESEKKSGGSEGDSDREDGSDDSSKQQDKEK